MIAAGLLLIIAGVIGGWLVFAYWPTAIGCLAAGVVAGNGMALLAVGISREGPRI